MSRQQRRAARATMNADDYIKMLERDLANTQQEMAATQQENSRLKKQLIEAGLWETYTTTGANAGAKAVTQRASQIIADLKEQLESYQKIIPSDLAHDLALPHKVLTDADPNTDVFILMFFRAQGKSEVIRFYPEPIIHPANLKDTMEHMLQPYGALVSNLPMPTEIAGTFDGLTPKERLDILEELQGCRLRSTDEFKRRRRELFAEVWPKLKVAGHYPNGRSTAQQEFNQFIDRTFRNMDQRYNGIRVTEINHQNLMTDKSEER